MLLWCGVQPDGLALEPSSQTAVEQSAPTHLPRSLWQVKPHMTQVAWTHEGALKIATSARARGESVAALFKPGQQDYRTIERMKITPETVIADIGCGTGPFVVDLLESSTPFGMVYAVDNDAPSLALLKALIAPMSGAEKVRVTKSQVGSTGLSPDSIDVMLVDNASLHMGPEQADPWLLESDLGYVKKVGMLPALRGSLRPQGRLHVIQNLGPSSRRAGEAVDVQPISVPYEQAGFALVSARTVQADGGAFSGVHLIFSR